MPSTGLLKFKLRPAIIISSDRLNQILDDVMVVPYTSNTKRHLTATQHLLAGEEIAQAGIKVELVIRCESIFTLNQSMILRTLGFLSTDQLNSVNLCLISALGL